MKTVVITGNEGFTGRYVTDIFLRGGWNVYGSTGVDLLEKDFVDKWIQEMRIDALIHLAANAFVGTSEKGSNFVRNLTMTKNIFESLNRHKKKPASVIVASSASVYGNCSNLPIKEDERAEPTNNYARSKLEVESYTRALMNEHPITITRPFNYTGVGQKNVFLIPKIVNHFREKRHEIVLGNLEVARDFSDVRDVATAYLKLVENPAPGEVFNISSGKSWKLGDVISFCEQHTSSKMNVLSSAGLSRENEILDLRGDSTKLTNHIGQWNRKPFEETLRWMLDDKPSNF